MFRWYKAVATRLVGSTAASCGNKSISMARGCPRTEARVFSTAMRKTQYLDAESQPHQYHQQLNHHQRQHTDAMRHYLQRHGYQLANVNPIRQDGFMTDPSIVKECLPKSMSKLIDLLVQSRQIAVNTTESCNEEDNFLKVLNHYMLQSERISIHEKDALILNALINSYCKDIGFEFDHCHTEAERQFFVNAIEHGEAVLEQAGIREMKPAWMLEQLYRAQTFERLLHERYSTAKTFGIEGMEAAVLAVNTIVETFAAGKGDKQARVLLGTTHRGRINMLANSVKLPWPTLISIWDETNGPSYDNICDPCSSYVPLLDNSTRCHLSLLPIPAHLEAMVPALLGNARAYATEIASTRTKGAARKSNNSATELATDLVLPLSLHGDSSFCGEGIIQETLQLSLCQHYECGGTIHMILNNQVGFTTELSSIKSWRTASRSSQSSDIMRSVGAPIIHVNANKPRAVARACQLAVLYRQNFGSDIMIDLVGWRKRGHNEMDDPTMTNVGMYHTVKDLEPVTDAFEKELLKSGILSGIELNSLQAKIGSMFQNARAVKRNGHECSELCQHMPLEGDIESLKENSSVRNQENSEKTSISLDHFQRARAPLVTVPDGFTMHPIVGKTIKSRREALDCFRNMNGKVDFATAELLALSSLATEGTRVRLSGQDSQRGTFAQRHAVWHDIRTGTEHAALPPLMEATNSPLSELSIVSFEFGWSLCNPNSLTLWEAQFGDFSNEAQVIFDTILSSSAEKWNVDSNLVLLLPHGYDGMGPEHSSCRPERWLQMFASEPVFDDDDQDAMYKASNFVVACPTDPANYFHLLRRQLAWPFRRPLIVLSPKRLLRNPAATSPLSHFLDGGTQEKFLSVLDDPATQDQETQSNVRGILLCSGEVYYDLCKLREQHSSGQMANTAIIRVEQMAPFPSRELNNILEQYPNVGAVAWVQEEPANDGAAAFIRDQLQYKQTVSYLKNNRDLLQGVEWISLPEAAAPALGHPHRHAQAHNQVLQDVVRWCEKLER